MNDLSSSLSSCTSSCISSCINSYDTDEHAYNNEYKYLEYGYFDAVETGDLDHINTFLNNINLDANAEEGAAIDITIYNNDLHALKFILDNSYIDITQYNNWAFAYALEVGTVEIVSYLYSLGCRLTRHNVNLDSSKYCMREF